MSDIPVTEVLVFTPVSKHSAIARVSALVVSELRQRGVLVEIVSTDEFEPALDDQIDALGLPIHWRQSAQVQARVATADLVVHQLGNNFGFHAGSIHWRGTGGIFCLHDFFLGGMFAQWAAGHEVEAAEILKEWYGLELAWLQKVSVDPHWIGEAWPEVTFAEWLLACADGVVAHSRHGIESVLGATGAPVEVAALPYPGQPPSPSTVRTDATSIRALTVGAVNRNKLPDLVIEALGGSDGSSDPVEYRLLGECPPDFGSELVALARRHGVRLSLLGALPDGEVARELAAADLVCCLRFPSIESGSASVIEAMSAGKPVVVVDTGPFAEIPDDVAIKIDPANMLADLRRAFAELRSEPDRLARLGERGREWVLRTHRVDAYTDSLLRLAEAIGTDRARAEIVRDYSRRAGRFGIEYSPGVAEAVSDLAAFFGAAQSPSASRSRAQR